MDRKRSHGPDDENYSPSGKRLRHVDEAEANSNHTNIHSVNSVNSINSTSHAMQAVAHEALAMTNGVGGFSAINSARKPATALLHAKPDSPSGPSSADPPADIASMLTAQGPDRSYSDDVRDRRDRNGARDGHDLGNTNQDRLADGSARPSLETMSEITRHFQAAVAKAWDCRSPTYSRVHVLLLFWDEDDTEIRDTAAELESVFRTTCHYATDVFPIRSADTGDSLYVATEAFFAKCNSSAHLAVLYYAGHVVANRQAGSAPWWTPRSRNAGNARIDSRPVQAACEAATCDVLLLVDYGSAYLYPLTQASYGTARRNVIEVLDARGFDPDAGSISFTKALAEELAAVAQAGPISVEALKAHVAKRMSASIASSHPRGRGRPPKDTLSRTAASEIASVPKHYFLFQRRSIVLTPLSLEPQIVLCLRLLSGSTDLQQWGKWIFNASPQARNTIKIEGFHLGFSAAIAIRVPASEWPLVLECPSSSLVGYTTIGDIDPAALDAVDSNLAAKLWPMDPMPQRLLSSLDGFVESASTTAMGPPYPSTNATTPASAHFDVNYDDNRAVGTTAGTTADDGGDGTNSASAEGSKKNRKALPTERKPLASKNSPTSGRRNEFGDDRRPREAHYHQYPLGRVQGDGGGDAGELGTEKNPLLADAAHKPFKISIKLAGQSHVCKDCKAGFKDADSLQNHVRKHHTRPFHCVFHWAACESTFASKNEWKRHVMSQHILLQYWVCQVETCSKVVNGMGGGKDGSGDGSNIGGISLPNGAIFNRKDLFTQHLRRMHTPPLVKKLMKQAKQGAKVPPHPSIVEWENRLKELQQDGLKPRCRLPEYMVCPAEGCGIEFHGNNAWDDRMEHVARHLEAASAGREPPVIFGGLTDETLTQWSTRPEVGIAKRVGPDAWHLDNPLRPEIMAWTEDLDTPKRESQDLRRNSQQRLGQEGSGSQSLGFGHGMGSTLGHGLGRSHSYSRERSGSVIEVVDEDRRPDTGDRRLGRETNSTGIPVN